jgi:uncharacterized protein (DUF433 family)
MNELQTDHRHIARNPETGEPMIKATGISVRAIAEWWNMGAQPEEILVHFPHLTLSQVFDALSFYVDHKQEVDQFIEANRIPEDLSGTRLP